MVRRPLNYCSEGAYDAPASAKIPVVTLPWSRELFEDVEPVHRWLKAAKPGEVLEAIEAATCEHCGDFTGECDCECECVTCGRKGYEVTFYCGLECEDCALKEDDA